MSQFKNLKGAKKKIFEGMLRNQDTSEDSLSGKTVTVVNTWMKLQDDRRTEAMHAAFVLLMSDFLFSNIALPEHWLRRLVDLKMLKISKSNKTKALSAPLMVAVEMLFRAQDYVAENLSKSRYDLLGIVEFIVRVEFTGISFDKVISLAKGQEQMEKICTRLFKTAKRQYPIADELMKGLDITKHEFATNYDRRLLVSLLVSRALASIILKIGATDGSQSAVTEMMAICNDTEEAVWHRKKGNDEFQNREYERALATYSIAINKSKCSAASYCNRCQTALKLKDYKLAISDGYRAIALKPNWGKAYYRQAEAFREDNRLPEAIFCNERGLLLADDESEKEELRKQKIKFCGADKDSKDNNSEAGGSKKEKKMKLELECVPDLLGDDDSMFEFSGDEMNGTKYEVKKSSEKKEAENKKQHASNGSRPRIKKSNKFTAAAVEDTKNRGKEASQLPQSKIATVKAKEEAREKTEKKQPEKAPKPNISPVKKPQLTPADFAQNLTDHRLRGSKALLAKDYALAMSEYDFAIKIVEKQVACKEFPKIQRVDRFVLIYSRGKASLETRSSLEITRSLDFFAMLLGSNSSTADVVHPMVYYAVAHAQYLLNNFFIITSPLNLGIKMIKEKRAMPMKWPGIDTVIPESQPEKLLKLMNELKRTLQHPPKPAAVCFFMQCGANDKNESKSYSMCEKEVCRKEIYPTDHNFEDVLDFGCLTDGCKGTLCRIIMIDENLEVKKNITSEKASVKDKEESKKMPGTRMSKNERNLTKRMKQLEEAKDKKQELKKKTNEAKVAASVKTKTKKPAARVFTDEDLKNATILRPHNNEPRVKISKPKSKKRYNTLTLNNFLANSRDKLDMREIEQVIINSQASDTPFQVPNELRDEIAQFESELTDEDIFWTSCIYEYFENFFEQSGPVKVQDDLLLQQQLYFSDKMKKVIEKHNDIISFLCKNQCRFLIVAPYIGLPHQQAQLTKLSNDFQKSLKPKKTTTRTCAQTSSMLDTLDCDFDGPSTLSDFARDLYDVGDVSLSQVRSMTGSGAPVAVVSGHDPDEGLLYPQTDVIRNDIPLQSNHMESPKAPWIGSGLPNRGGGDELDDFLVTEMDIYLQEQSTESAHANIGPYGDGAIHQSPEPEVDVTESSEFEEESTSYEALCAHVGIQADLTLPCEKELETLRQERLIVDKTVAELSERLTKLTTSSREEIAYKTKEVKDTREQLLAMQKISNDQAKHYNIEAKKFAKERGSYQEDMKAINEKLKEVQNKNKDMELRIRSQQEDCDRISRNYQEQRSSWLEEKAQFDREKETLRNQLQQANARVLEAEVKALECEKNFSLKTLFKARNDCERIVSDFEKMMRHYSNIPAAQAEVLKGYQKWKTNIDTCTQYIEQAKQQFQINSELLRSGKHLNELTHVQVPTPPPPGPNIQQVAMMARQISMGNGLGGSASVPINPFQPLTSPSSTSPSLSANGNASTSPVPTTRSPQPPIGTGKQMPPPIGAGMQQVPPIGAQQPVAPSPSVTPPMSVPVQNNAPSSSNSQPKGSFEKIMVQLQQLYPTASRSDLALCIKEVRQNNNNSLTGLSFDDIVQQASVVVTRKQNVQPNNVMTSSNTTSWPYNNNRGSQNSAAYNVDDVCVICHDPLKLHQIHQLKCAHTFHNKCLNKWLQHNRTCPTCRDYAIDTNEFPTLATLTRR